jgi:hypothetical protein
MTDPTETANRGRRDAAERTLGFLGYTWVGGELWKPPIVQRPATQPPKGEGAEARCAVHDFPIERISCSKCYEEDVAAGVRAGAAPASASQGDSLGDRDFDRIALEVARDIPGSACMEAFDRAYARAAIAADRALTSRDSLPKEGS